MANLATRIGTEFKNLRANELSLLATKAEIADMVVTSDLSTLATKAEIADMVVTSDLAPLATKAEITDMVVTSDLAPLANKDNETLTNVTLSGAVTVNTHILAGTHIDPANGTTQELTLTANTTLTANIADGQMVTLVVKGADQWLLTFPPLQWLSSSGNIAPVLSSHDILVIFKIGTTLYAAHCGSSA